MNGVSVGELLAAFESNSEVSIQAKNALLSGARFDIWLDPLPASRLRGILRGRVRSLERHGKTVSGLAECLASLAEKGDQGLVVAYVDDRERAGRLYPLYLDPQPLKVVACIGFDSSSGGGPKTGSD